MRAGREACSVLLGCGQGFTGAQQRLGSQETSIGFGRALGGLGFNQGSEDFGSLSVIPVAQVGCAKLRPARLAIPSSAAETSNA